MAGYYNESQRRQRQREMRYKRHSHSNSHPKDGEWRITEYVPRINIVAVISGQLRFLGSYHARTNI